MTFQHCFSTLGCPDLSVREAAALAIRHNVPLLEIRAISGSVDIVAQLTAEFGTPAAFAEWIGTQPIQVVALDTSVRLLGDRFDLEALEAIAVWAEAVGAKHMRIFDGGIRLDEGDLAQAAERLQLWGERRQANGWTVDVMIETHDALADPSQLRQFVAAQPDAILLWDAHHTWAKGGENPVATWAAIRPLVRHVHVKDSVVGGKGRQYVLPGQGEFPMATLLAALGADGYVGPLSLEWELMWHRELPALDAALAAANGGWW